jgi:ribosomal protein S18 acetylase RimI-like enzyme
MRIRYINTDDRAILHALVAHAGVFEPHEVAVAEEVIDASLSDSHDYSIYLAEEDDAERAGSPAVGFVCHGHNPVTDAVYDIYWIVVAPHAQRRGIGRALLSQAESSVREKAGRAITIETSGRPEYRAARSLYEACGYRLVAEIPDFYKPGDAMCVYMKNL